MHDGRCFAGFIEDVDYESDLATVRVKAVSLKLLNFNVLCQIFAVIPVNYATFFARLHSERTSDFATWTIIGNPYW